MNILILHPNFPAQFRVIARYLAESGNTVLFACQTHFGRKVKGVERFTLPGFSGYHSSPEKHGPRGQQDQQGNSKGNQRSQAYRQGLLSLKSEGFTPDVIISHTGWSCGTYSAEIWPQSMRIGYVEWWFSTSSSLIKYNTQSRWSLFEGSRNELKKISFQRRNTLMLQELSYCHALVAPTFWQRAQLPTYFKKDCKVIHDGVDLDLFAPSRNDVVEGRITYGTRGMEVTRGFPEFIEELPSLLSRFPSVTVQIAGEDEIHYGGPTPPQGSWGEWAYDIIGQYVLEGRVSFLGRLSLDKYSKWLRTSWLHIYLTQPYVASWSLVEAMASGCSIIASDVEAVREFLSPAEGILEDHRKPGWLVKAVESIHADPGKRHSMSECARLRAMEYDQTKTNRMWQSLLWH